MSSLPFVAFHILPSLFPFFKLDIGYSVLDIGYSSGVILISFKSRFLRVGLFRAAGTVPPLASARGVSLIRCLIPGPSFLGWDFPSEKSEVLILTPSL